MAAGSDEEHLVIGLDDRVALRQDRVVAAEDGRHAGVDVGHVTTQLAQLLAHQRAAVIGAYCHQLRLAAGEVDHLQRAGMLDQAFDVIGHHLFRADQHVHRNGFVVEQTRAHQIGRLAHPGDLGRRVKQRVGDLAGDHVGFVAVGHRHQHVGVVGAGLAQHGGKRAAALNGADVQAVAEIAQAIAVGVHHGDVVGFAGEVFGEGAADLTGTEDDDLHAVTPERQPSAAASMLGSSLAGPGSAY